MKREKVVSTDYKIMITIISLGLVPIGIGTIAWSTLQTLHDLSTRISTTFEAWAIITAATSIVAIYLILKDVWGIGTKKLLKLMTKLMMRSTMESIADEIEEAASSAISMSEVAEEVQTDEQSIEIEVETPEIVIQRQSKPADKTKAKLQKLKELHNEGLISDEDYAEEKRNILKEM